jgi:diguanylate cyclase (GGDEF)-like protein
MRGGLGNRGGFERVHVVLGGLGTSSAAGRLRRMDFWALNRVARAFLLGVESLAFVLTGVALTTRPATSRELASFALLLVMAVGYAEVTARVELVRRYLGIDSPKAWTSYTSVWAIAAVLVLPTGYAALLTAAVYAHVLVLGQRHRTVRPHRLVFSAATMVLAALAAAELLAQLPHSGQPYSSATSALAATLAVVLFWIVNLGIVLLGMYLAVRPRRLMALLPRRDAVLLEYLTLALGVVTGVVVTYTLFLTPLVFVLITTTHRSSLVADLRVAASTDTKTGLLNAATWRERARQSLSYAARNERPACVLVIDLDYFKVVNDQFGHLVGDQVLVRVAETLRSEVRDHDLVGRFGGEEFVVCLDAASFASANAIAERLRERIASGGSGQAVTVTASIGVAYAARPGSTSLDDLLGAADTALYTAKEAGRDQVHVVKLSDCTVVRRVG